MTKKDFIQRVIARSVPPLEKVVDGIRYAEHLWHRLTEHGYGAPAASGPRDTVDWYKKLQGASKKQFDGFWKAFGHKHGKQRAAMRWYKLGDLTQAEAEKIINAAAAEAARRQAPGAVRKMAEGWLTEQRWQDHETAPQPKRERKEKHLRELKQDLAALKQLNINGSLDQQIADRAQEIRALQACNQ